MSSWEDVDEWEDIPDATPRMKKLNKEMSHTGKTTSYIGPGSYNPFVHAGKDMLGFASGIRQIFGDVDNEFSREVQNMSDTYNDYDQPLVGQLGGLALMAAPELASAPAALATTAAPLLGRHLAKQTADKILRKQYLTMPAGVKGATLGAGYGAAYHVDPDDPNPGLTRTMNAGLGAAFGLPLDAAEVGTKYWLSQRAANAKRDALSGSLPKRVDLPGPELWDQKSQAVRAKQYRESGTDLTWGKGANTKELYESGYNKARTDIADNVDILREQMTGKKQPVPKGESIRELAEELPIGREANREYSKNAMNDFIDNKSNVLSVDADVFFNLANEFNKYRKHNIHNTSHKEQINKLVKSVDTTYDKIVGDYLNIKDIEDLYVSVTNVLDDTNPKGTAGKAAKKLKQLLDEATESLEPGKNVFGSAESYSNYVAAKNARRKFVDTYYNNDIINAASTDKGLSPNELSDRLFGAKTLTDSADQQQAIDTILQLSGKYKKPLKREVFQQLASGQQSHGREFNIADFIRQYGEGVDTGTGLPNMRKLFNNKELKQLNDLYTVSRKLEHPQGYIDTSVKAQLGASNIMPTIQNLTNVPRKAYGEPLEDYLRAVRYGSGHQYAGGNSRITPKLAGILGATYGENDLLPTEEEQATKDSIARLLKVLLLGN